MHAPNARGPVAEHGPEGTIRDALGIIAHAFAGPVISSRVAARELLGRYPADEDVRAVVLAVRRAEVLLDGLTRLQATERPPLPERVGLDAALRSALRRVRAHGLTPDVHADPLDTVLADEAHLTAMLAELLGNVANHAAPESRVRIHCTREDDVVQLTLTDTGPGFPQGVDRARPVAFSSVGRSAGSAGCGLAIVFALAALNEGSVELGDGDEGGARVTLTLPAGGG
jgi:signal transduction histidine kinase